MFVFNCLRVYFSLFFAYYFCSIHSLNCNFLISGLFLNLLILFIYRPFIYLHISAIIYIVSLINLSTIPVHRLSWKKHKSDRHILSMAVWCQWDRRFDSDMRLYVVYVYCSYVPFVWGSCMNSFQIWQKWVDFIYEFTSDIKKVDLGGGRGASIYIYKVIQSSNKYLPNFTWSPPRNPSQNSSRLR